jgi:hypothetical protein
VHSVRADQARALKVQGAAWGAVVLLLSLLAALAIAPSARLLGWALLAAGVLGGLALFVLFGWWLAQRRVGDAVLTAHQVAAAVPSLRLDVVAAVELAQALGPNADFSADLAAAFMRDVDARASHVKAKQILDPRPRRLAVGAAVVVAVGTAYLALVFPERAWAGAHALVRRPARLPVKRAPITGDFTLTYRYPAYMNREAKVVSGTSGEISGPPGTEVQLSTRADRDVDGAALEVNGARLPLVVKGRALEGSIQLDQPGQYHVLFLDGSTVVAEGPDLSVRIEPDTAPSVEVLSPQPELELDPGKTEVPVSFSIADDVGLTKVELVVRPAGRPEQRLPVKVDDGRTARGTYVWNVAALKLPPGSTVSYQLEATDNDAVRGPKVGTSRTQTLTLYSAAAHHRAALAQAEALWERLVTHLADRQESPERNGPALPRADGDRLDARAREVAQDFIAFANAQRQARDPLPEVPEALAVASKTLRDDTTRISMRRRPSVDMAAVIDADLKHSEASVLYLEKLLDRRKLDALESLADALREDRRMLSSLVDELKKSPDEKSTQALLAQMQLLKEHMQALRQQMAELAKGIRDEFVNQEGLQEQLREDTGIEQALDEVEQLVKNGKTEEAAKRMQELAMEMDSMLDQLKQASAQADEEADPELTREVQAFEQALEKNIAEQQAVLEETEKLQAKAKTAMAERLKRQGPAAKAQALEQLAALEKALQQPTRNDDGRRAKALSEVKSTQQALQADDFDSAAEAAQQLEQSTEELQAQAEAIAAQDEAFSAPSAFRRESARRAEQSKRDTRAARDVSESLQRLFPRGGEGLSADEQQRLGQLAQKEKALGQATQSLEGQMERINERAPVFNDEAKGHAAAANKRMREASGRLERREAGRAAGAQQGALQSLQSLKQGLQQQQQQAGAGQGKGLPRPFASGSRRGQGNGRENEDKALKLPDEDPNKASRELRQDVMEAMKQGAPDRYRDQNKRYYEELVK